MNQKLAVKILEKYGHAVEIAENGSLAVDSYKLRVAQGRPFDIVLVRCFFCRPLSFHLFPIYISHLLITLSFSVADGRIDAVYGRNGSYGTYRCV